MILKVTSIGRSRKSKDQFQEKEKTRRVKLPHDHVNSDCITVKSDRWNMLFIAFSYLVLLSLGCFFLANQGGFASVTGMGLCVIAVGSIFCVRWCVAVFRRICITRDGIDSAFLFWRKFYHWDEISVFYESYRSNVSLRAQYDGTVILALKTYHVKPKWMQPILYCILIHPFSFFFVNFQEENRYPGFPGVYSVSKKEFISRMHLWNITEADFPN